MISLESQLINPKKKYYSDISSEIVEYARGNVKGVKGNYLELFKNLIAFGKEEISPSELWVKIAEAIKVGKVSNLL
ncbi:hypothetical protein [Rickettsia gravesii]|uniref:hypothetical protein n=1 Tax=Rickettsia gravesii TaxID=354585 RepID=UPI000371BEC9|nr:hypothetical protein [Rickettsia gravesii]